MTTSVFHLAPLGDAALTIRLGDRPSAESSRRLHIIADRIRARRLPGITDVVPAWTVVTVFYDSLLLRYEDARSALLPLVSSDDPGERPPRGREWSIPVRYDGADLAAVAAAAGLTEDEVIARHSAPDYEVLVVGFVPGFGYLGGLDPALVLPRRPTPRPRVPAGSVAIGGSHTGVYPFETPGGWHLLGTTDLVLFDPNAERPALLAVCDKVRFHRAGG